MRKRLTPILGGLIAAAVALGAIVWLSNRQPATETTMVFAVTQPVAQGTQLTQGMVTQESIATADVPAGAVTSINAIVGSYAAVDLTPQEVIVPSLLISAGSSATSATTSGGTTQAATIPPVDIGIKDGDVVMNIPTDRAIGEDGYILPNDHIDILVDTNGYGSMAYFLQDIRVVATPAASALPASGSTQNGGAASGTYAASGYLLVEVTRYQAKELAVLLGESIANATQDVPLPHIVRYILRPRDQDGKGDLASGPPATQPSRDIPVTPATLQGLFGR